MTTRNTSKSCLISFCVAFCLVSLGKSELLGTSAVIISNMALLSFSDMEEPILSKGQWQWWLLAAINTIFLIVGQSAAVLLGRFYYEQGGNSTWLATLVQNVAFPILFIPLFLLPVSLPHETSICVPPSIGILTLLYFSIGVLTACDNMMHSVGLLYLSASTYSLICASQIAFNVVFSCIFNSQKLTFLISVSVLVLSLSAVFVAFDTDSDGPFGVSKWNYYLGFLSTLGASALYSLLLSLMQLSFEKVIKKETFSVVLEMLIYTSIVATCFSIVGLFASGEWQTLPGEMQSFGKGSVSYVMTLVWTAVAWQVCTVGVVGLIFTVSSLFSNAISTVALAVSPTAAVIVFHDEMSIPKVLAMLLAFLGFACFTYQNYLDDSEVRTARSDASETDSGFLSS